jgi:hypothetical protein
MSTTMLTTLQHEFVFLLIRIGLRVHRIAETADDFKNAGKMFVIDSEFPQISDVLL